MPYALFFKAQASGIAEVVKYGLIKDGEFFEWQESCMEKMAARDEMVLAEAVERSCVNKAKVRGSRGGGGGRRWGELASTASSGLWVEACCCSAQIVDGGLVLTRQGLLCLNVLVLL